MRLKEAAGWNQTETDWRNLMRLAPEGCFGIEGGAGLAATTTAVCFGRELAWIGMVLTHPEYRGRGLARALMEHAVAYLESKGVEWIKLDATHMGRPLYAKLGFEDECAIERWGSVAGLSRDPAGLPERAENPGRSLDREAFGADRGGLLHVLAQIDAAATGDGFAMGRPGANAAYFGPCVARDAGSARQLLRWFLSRHTGDVYWDILPQNREAVRLAEEHGFRPLRKLVRMARPGRHGARPFRHDDSLVYAIAGFEYG